MENINERENEFTKAEKVVEIVETVETSEIMEANEEEYKCDVLIIPREKIISSLDNAVCGYTVEDDISALAYSIRLEGLGEPLNVIPQEDGTYFLAGGHRRIKALRYGDAQGWNWFKSGYPCVISTAPTKKETDIDRKIYIHELNIHNRDNSSHIYELVHSLLSLYKQKENKTKTTKKMCQLLAEKLGVCERQGRTIAYIAEMKDGWIREACINELITKDCAYAVGHMPEVLQEELHQYLKDHGKIEKNVILAYKKRKYAEYDAPVWIKDALSKNLITVDEAFRIGYSSSDSKAEVEKYIEEHQYIPGYVIDENLESKKEKAAKNKLENLKESSIEESMDTAIDTETTVLPVSTETVDTLPNESTGILGIIGTGNTSETMGTIVEAVEDAETEEPKPDSEEILPASIAAVTSGKTKLKIFNDPTDFEIEGLNPDKIIPPKKPVINQEDDYGDGNIENTGFENPVEDDSEYPVKENLDSFRGEDMDESEAEEAKEMPEYEDDDPDGYNDWDDRSLDDGHDTNQEEEDDIAEPSEKAPKIPKSTKKADDHIYQIMNDSVWWFGKMFQNGGMTMDEQRYVDIMFTLMKEFYFPVLAESLKKETLSENMKNNLHEIYSMLSPYFDAN